MDDVQVIALEGEGRMVDDEGDPALGDEDGACGLEPDVHLGPQGEGIGEPWPRPCTRHQQAHKRLLAEVGLSGRGQHPCCSPACAPSRLPIDDRGPPATHRRLECAGEADDAPTDHHELAIGHSELIRRLRGTSPWYGLAGQSRCPANLCGLHSGQRRPGVLNDRRQPGVRPEKT